MRFGAKNILKIQVFRPVADLKKIINKRKNFKRKLKKTKKQNYSEKEKEMIWIKKGLFGS